MPIYPYDNSSRNNVGSNPDFPNISTGRILYMDNYQSEEVMKMLSEYEDYATYMHWNDEEEVQNIGIGDLAFHKLNV